MFLRQQTDAESGPAPLADTVLIGKYAGVPLRDLALDDLAYLARAARGEERAAIVAEIVARRRQRQRVHAHLGRRPR